MGTIVSIRRRLYGWVLLSRSDDVYGWVLLSRSDDVSMIGYYCLDQIVSMTTTSLWMGTIVWIRRRLYGWVLLSRSDDVSMDGYYCLDPTTSLWMGTIVWIRRRPL